MKILSGKIKDTERKLKEVDTPQAQARRDAAADEEAAQVRAERDGMSPDQYVARQNQIAESRTSRAEKIQLKRTLEQSRQEHVDIARQADAKRARLNEEEQAAMDAGNAVHDDRSAIDQNNLQADKYTKVMQMVSQFANAGQQIGASGGKADATANERFAAVYTTQANESTVLQNDASNMAGVSQSLSDQMKSGADALRAAIEANAAKELDFASSWRSIA